MNTIHKFGAAAAIASVVAFVPTSAFAFLDFQVDESGITGVPGEQDLFWADKINGGYSEQLTINPDGSFYTVGFASFSGFFQNDGTTLYTESYLNGPGTSGYGMYAVFESGGVFDFGTGSFAGTTASFTLYLDFDKNTVITYGATAYDPYTLNGFGDDYAIGAASNVIRAVGLPGTPGAFDLIWDDFALVFDADAVIDGDRYFVQPRPFYTVLQVNGDFDEDNFQAGTFSVTGDVSAVFKPLEVPEPGTLALLGLAFAGLGFTARRRNS